MSNTERRKQSLVDSIMDPISLEQEYMGMELDDLVALKKKLFLDIDISQPKSPEEKTLDMVIAKKYSDINEQIINKRKLTTLSDIDIDISEAISQYIPKDDGYFKITAETNEYGTRYIYDVSYYDNDKLLEGSWAVSDKTELMAKAKLYKELNSRKLSEYVIDYIKNYGTKISERVSQKLPSESGSIEKQEEAALYIRRRIETARKEQPGLSSEQERIIQKKAALDFSKQNDLWIKDLYSLGNPSSGGGNENTLAYNSDDGFMYKSNNLSNHHDSILGLFDSIKYHNEIFDCDKYEFVGFTGIDNGANKTPHIEPIFRQYYLEDHDQATQSEIASLMNDLGFEKVSDDTFKNDKYIVSDLKPRNVLKDEDGNICVVDDIVKLNNMKMNQDIRTNAIGLLTGSKVERIEGKGYEFVEGDLISGSNLYYDLVGMVTGSVADRLVDSGITIKKRRDPIKSHTDMLKELGFESKLPHYEIYRKGNMTINIAKGFDRKDIIEDGNASIGFQLKINNLPNKTVVKNFGKFENLLEEIQKVELGIDNDKDLLGDKKKPAMYPIDDTWNNLNNIHKEANAFYIENISPLGDELRDMNNSISGNNQVIAIKQKELSNLENSLFNANHTQVENIKTKIKKVEEDISKRQQDIAPIVNNIELFKSKSRDLVQSFIDKYPEYQNELYIGDMDVPRVKYDWDRLDMIKTAIRNKYYDKWISEGRMTKEEADVIIKSAAPEPEKIKEETPASDFSTKRQKLDEFFTPDWVADIMVGLAYKHGFKGGSVLEPSFGHGVFFDRLANDGLINFTGFEIYKPNFDYVQAKYPETTLYNTYFEYAFLSDKDFKSIQKFEKDLQKPSILHEYNLIIGNPPYGDHKSPHAYLFDSKLQIRAEGFFLWLCAQKLAKNGVMVMLLPSLWLHNGEKYNKQKEEISKHLELVDAYRLPNNVFEKTKIATDILVFKKLN